VFCVGVSGNLVKFALAHGWAVASQDGGHENSQLAYPNAFYLEQQAAIDHAYRAVDVTTQTAKVLIDAYYGKKPDRSYFVGCSTGGRQGMVLSQNFPDYYDGIVAGDPVYNLEAICVSEAWSVEHIKAITPAPIRRLADGNPILYPAFPEPDQNLFQSALLAACDHLDGVVDGVIDSVAECQATFNPATFVFPSTGQPLQCIGIKTAALPQSSTDRCHQEDQRGTEELPGRGDQITGRQSSKSTPTIRCAVMLTMEVT
jgi:hypothetical protein